MFDRQGFRMGHYRGQTKSRVDSFLITQMRAATNELKLLHPAREVFDVRKRQSNKRFGAPCIKVDPCIGWTVCHGANKLGCKHALLRVPASERCISSNADTAQA